MAYGLSSDVVIAVLIEETTGADPSPETADVPAEFRRKIRAQVRAIDAAGGVIDIPFEIPDPEATASALRIR